MTQDNHIIFAYEINGDGSAKRLSGDDISTKVKEKALAWVHMDATLESTRGWLEKEASYLDTIVLDALLADETRPRIMELEHGTLLILRGVNLNDNSKPEDMVSIRLWVDKNRIISLQRRQLKAVKDIASTLEEGNGPQSSGDFVVALASRLFERMEPVFTDLEERLDDIEETVLENPDIKARHPVTEIRKQAIVFRRYVAPQRDAISNLRMSEQKWLNATHKRKIQESLDMLTRYVEDLEAIRERAQVVKDELAATLSDKMNKNLYMLSIIAAIFLPLGFLTGLVGINLAGIPGAENPYGFIIFCIVLAIVFVLQIVLFKRLKWM